MRYATYPHVIKSHFDTSMGVYQNYYFIVAVEGVSKCAQRAAKPSNVHNRRCSDLWTQTVGGRYNHANRPRERSNNYLMLILFDLSRGRYTMCVRHPQVSFAVRSLHQRLRMVGRLRRPILNFDTLSTIGSGKLVDIECFVRNYCWRDAATPCLCKSMLVTWRVGWWKCVFKKHLFFCLFV